MKTYHAVHEDALRNGSYCVQWTFKRRPPAICQYMQGDHMGWRTSLPEGLKTFTVQEVKNITKGLRR